MEKLTFTPDVISNITPELTDQMSKWIDIHQFKTATMIVKIREIIRDCITFGMHFIYTRIYQMNIDKSAKLSFGAILDKSNPKGVHIGEESFIASGAVILAHDFSKPAKADTYIGKRCFIGVNAIIMCGVKVNDNVIVGSGSVSYKRYTCQLHRSR